MAKPPSKRKKTPSYILELRLDVSSKDDAVFIRSIEAHRQLYNAVLGESLTRLNQMRQDGAFDKARKMKKGQEKTSAFKALRDKYGLTENCLEKYAKACRDNCYIRDHVRSADSQATADRAFDAVMAYAYGKKGRPRFKGKRRFRSIEGKQNTVVSVKKNTLSYLGRKVLVLFDGRKKEREYQQFDQANIKYCRILWRNVDGQRRWYVQLILKGKPPIKAKYREHFAKAKDKTVSADLGPSEIAIYSDEYIAKINLAEGIDYPWKELKRLRRKMDRARRAANPGNYHDDGTIRKGKKTWVNSRRYEALRNQAAEIERVIATRRKTYQGRLANIMHCIGNHKHLENVSHFGWQRRFGRSSKIRASGQAQALITRKAANAGGDVLLINTHQTKLSQYCHVSDTCIKKPLSQRYHEFPDGQRVDRDIYSAFLAHHVKELPDKGVKKGEAKMQHVLGTRQALDTAWQAMDSRLKRTVPRTLEELAKLVLGEPSSIAKDSSSAASATTACVGRANRSQTLLAQQET